MLRRLRPWAVFLGALAVYWLFRCPRTVHDEHIRLAWALLHGHWYVDGMAPWEHVDVLGHSYELHPVLSALVCVPFVTLGIYNQTAISLIVGAVGVATCYRMVEALREAPVIDASRGRSVLDREVAGEMDAEPGERDCRDDPYDEASEGKDSSNHAMWLTIFFALGTVYGYEATYGASWGFCLTVSTIPTFLALTELFGRRRPLLVGLFAAVAFFARTDLICVWPVYLLWIVTAEKSPFVLCGARWWPHLQRALLFSAPCGVALALYLALNLVRFGTWYDPTLWMWYAQDVAGGKIYPWGPFSLHYLPLGLFTAIFAGPSQSLQFPFLHPRAFGQSLLTTSPALLLAWRVRLSPQAWLLLAGCALSMGPALIVWSNGVEQLGARYWIQALPFLLALMARTPLDRFAKTLILASILFCCWGTMVVRLYGWA